MSNQGLKWLAGACGLLIMGLFIEWIVMGAAKRPLSELQVAVKAIKSETMELPKLSIKKQLVGKYFHMVENPLFIEGRKPMPDVETEVISQAVGKIEDLILVGIYSIQGRITALFEQKGGDKASLKKSEGDDVSGWLLKEVQSDRVILEQAGKEQTLLLRKPKPKTKPGRKSRIKPNPFKSKQIKPNPFESKQIKLKS